MDRREFIKRSVECAAYATAGIALSGFLGKNAGAAETPDIVVAYGAPGPAAMAAMKVLGGMERFVRPKDRVVIKPNMSSPNPPEWATTTHPEVIRALTEMCIKVGAGSVLILDNMEVKSQNVKEVGA